MVLVKIKDRSRDAMEVFLRPVKLCASLLCGPYVIISHSMAISLESWFAGVVS